MSIWPIHAEVLVQIDVPAEHSKRRSRDVPKMTLIWIIEREFVDNEDAPVCRKRGINARRHWPSVGFSGRGYDHAKQNHSSQIIKPDFHTTR
jgi:hypothetical protein